MERGEEMLWSRVLERGAVYAQEVMVVAAVVGVVVVIVMGAVAVAAAVVALTTALPENYCYNTIFIKVAIQLHNYPKCCNTNYLSQSLELHITNSKYDKRPSI